MSKTDSLTYGDLAAYLSEYPPHATMLVDHMADADWTGDFDPAPNTVGQALEHSRSMPEDACPVVATTAGPSEIVGVIFTVESPIFMLTLV